MSIPGLDRWLETAQGRYVCAWESASVDRAIADVFGFNALQLGLPQWDLLRASRIPLRQKAGESGPVDVQCELTALPFAALSTDLVILPHVLEFSSDAHQILREVERILRLELTGVAALCNACGAPHSAGATFCWQCGTTLLQAVPGAAIAAGAARA